MTNAVLHPSFFFVVFHEFVLGASIRQSRILAEGLPLAGNGKFPLKERLVVIFFEIEIDHRKPCNPTVLTPVKTINFNVTHW